MLSALRTFLGGEGSAASAEAGDEETLMTATAVLLMEIARADQEISDAEREAIRRLLGRNYSVTHEEANAITRRAEERVAHETSLHPFTRLVNSECSLEERSRLVGMLWEITYADGHADAHEEHLVRRVANLLHVPHREFIRTRLEKMPDRG